MCLSASFAGGFNGVTATIPGGPASADPIVGQAWFEAACAQRALASGLLAAVTPTRIPVG